MRMRKKIQISEKEYGFVDGNAIFVLRMFAERCLEVYRKTLFASLPKCI